MQARIQDDVLFDLCVVLLFRFQLEGGCLVVERICRVWVQKELGQEGVEDVDEVVHGRPCLIDHVEAYTARRFVNVWVENLVDKPDRR